MLDLRRWLPLTIFVALFACRDMEAPLSESQMGNPVFDAAVIEGAPTPSEDLHILQQSPNAPALETYQVSFWARKDRASSVTVDYLPEAGQRSGRPFLRFDIPQDALKSIPGKSHVGRHDAVLITLTIDPTRFEVDFQPSGVEFDRRHPATLMMWYDNADRDLNADGVVNGADDQLMEQLALWTTQVKQAPWHRLVTGKNANARLVASSLYHFSYYAVSW